LLAILLGGGGFLFMYIRASSQGRQAARETTRAITTARAAVPPLAGQIMNPEAGVIEPPDAVEAVPAQSADTLAQPKQTLPLDDQDDTPEQALPDDPTQALGSVSALQAELPPTEAVRAALDDLPLTEAVPLAEPQPSDED